MVKTEKNSKQKKKRINLFYTGFITLISFGSITFLFWYINWLVVRAFFFVWFWFYLTAEIIDKLNE